jgi:hypothetical protein
VKGKMQKAKCGLRIAPVRQAALGAGGNFRIQDIGKFSVIVFNSKLKTKNSKL